MSKNIFVSIKGCDDSTDFYLTCTDEQLVFLREFAKMTKKVSDYSCMPIISLYDDEESLDKDESDYENVGTFFEDEEGDGYNELDTTKL